MKSKIIKGLMAVLLVCCISVPMSGCALVNPDVRDNFKDWTDDFLGGIFGDVDDDDDNENSGNENEGNQNGNENSGNSSGTVENTKFEGSGEMYVDHVNHISIRPTKTTVGVGETFSINVEKETGCTITENATFTVVSTGEQNVLSVDENGNVTALKVGEGAVQVKIGAVSYLVNLTVIEEATENTTYVLSCTHKYADRTIVINPYEVKMRVGDTFTLDVSTTSTDEPAIEVAEVNGGKWTSIENLTVTAVKAGTTQIWIEWGEDYPFLITVTII